MEFAEADRLLDPGYLAFESGLCRSWRRKKGCRSTDADAGCRAKMVDWWFSWLGGSDQYKWWHPTDHVLSDWENRVDGKYIGGAHLVHEYLAGRSEQPYMLASLFTIPQNFSTSNAIAKPVWSLPARILATSNTR